MENIFNMKFQLRHLHLGQYLIKKNAIGISKIYVSITVSLLQFIYIYIGVGKIANIQFYIILSTKTSQLKTITNKYCRRLC